MKTDNCWMYDGEPLTEPPEKKMAFVYLIEHVPTGLKYIGKKNFYSSKTKIVAGKKKKFKVESDWRDYYSSSEDIKEMVKGGDSFKRTILHLCANVGSANYLEAKEQFLNCVLEKPEEWLNGQIRCRIHHSHVKLS